MSRTGCPPIDQVPQLHCPTFVRMSYVFLSNYTVARVAVALDPREVSALNDMPEHSGRPVLRMSIRLQPSAIVKCLLRTKSKEIRHELEVISFRTVPRGILKSILITISSHAIREDAMYGGLLHETHETSIIVNRDIRVNADHPFKYINSIK